jgi:hypothetical protein
MWEILCENAARSLGWRDWDGEPSSSEDNKGYVVFRFVPIMLDPGWSPRDRHIGDHFETGSTFNYCFSCPAPDVITLSRGMEPDDRTVVLVNGERAGRLGSAPSKRALSLMDKRRTSELIGLGRVDLSTGNYMESDTPKLFCYFR